LPSNNYLVSQLTQRLFLHYLGKHNQQKFTFYARKQLCFQRVLAIAILSVRPSVCMSVRLTHK